MTTTSDIRVDVSDKTIVGIDVLRSIRPDERFRKQYSTILKNIVPHQCLFKEACLHNRGQRLKFYKLSVMEDMIDNLRGPWAVQNKDELKNRLRHLVDNGEGEARSSMKADILAKGLQEIGINIETIRVDEETGLISVIDAICMVNPDISPSYATIVLSRLSRAPDLETEPLVNLSKIQYLRINHRGHVTPVASMKVIMEIIWLVPGQTGEAFRSKCTQVIARVLGGDESLCREIEKRNERLCATPTGRQFQQMLMEGDSYFDSASGTKRKRYGPEIMQHVSEEMYERYIKEQYEMEMCNNKRDQFQEELKIIRLAAEAQQVHGFYDDRDKIEYSDRVRISTNAYHSRIHGSAPIAPDPAMGAISTTSTIDSSRDYSNVPPPERPTDVRGQETSMHIVASRLQITIGTKAGSVGKRMKKLYIERYGEEAGRNIPKRTTYFNGKPFPEKRTMLATRIYLSVRFVTCVCSFYLSFFSYKHVYTFGPSDRD